MPHGTIVWRLWKQPQARTHHILPIVEHYFHILWCVVCRIPRFIIVFTMARVIHRADYANRRPILINMIGDTFHIRQQIPAFSPVKSPRRIDKACKKGVTAGQTCLFGILPFKNTIRRDTGIHIRGHFCHLKILHISNKATAVSPSSHTEGKSNHISTLQLKWTNLIIEVCFCQSLHESPRVTFRIITANLPTIIRLGITCQRTDFFAIRQNNGTVGKHLYLAVYTFCRPFPFHENMVQPVGNELARTYVLNNDYRMFRIHYVHASSHSKRCFIRNHIIHISSQRHSVRNLPHPYDLISRKDIQREH